MQQQGHTDFLVAVGECFCGAFRGKPDFADASPHDYQEALNAAFGEPLTPDLLSHACTDEGLAKIAAAFAGYFEVGSVSVASVASAVRCSLLRWPLGSLG